MRRLLDFGNEKKILWAFMPTWNELPRDDSVVKTLQFCTHTTETPPYSSSVTTRCPRAGLGMST